MVDQSIQRALVVFMDHHSGALVAQKNVIVFIEDVQPGSDAAEGFLFLHRLEKFIVDIKGEHIPLGQPVAGLAPFAIAFDPLEAHIFVHQGGGQ